MGKPKQKSADDLRKKVPNRLKPLSSAEVHVDLDGHTLSAIGCRDVFSEGHVFLRRADGIDGGERTWFSIRFQRNALDVPEENWGGTGTRPVLATPYNKPDPRLDYGRHAWGPYYAGRYQIDDAKVEYRSAPLLDFLPKFHAKLHQALDAGGFRTGLSDELLQTAAALEALGLPVQFRFYRSGDANVDVARLPEEQRGQTARWWQESWDRQEAARLARVEERSRGPFEVHLSTGDPARLFVVRVSAPEFDDAVEVAKQLAIQMDQTVHITQEDRGWTLARVSRDWNRPEAHVRDERGEEQLQLLQDRLLQPDRTIPYEQFREYGLSDPAAVDGSDSIARRELAQGAFENGSEQKAE